MEGESRKRQPQSAGSKAAYNTEIITEIYEIDEDLQIEGEEFEVLFSLDLVTRRH